MPAKDLLTRLRAEIDKIQLADSHEHLHTERQRLDAGPNALGSLFAHYASSDLVSAGMSGEDLNFLRDGGKPLAPRLKRLMPYWSAISTAWNSTARPPGSGSASATPKPTSPAGITTC